jgi:hypothetical protein
MEAWVLSIIIIWQRVVYRRRARCVTSVEMANTSDVVSQCSLLGRGDAGTKPWAVNGMSGAASELLTGTEGRMAGRFGEGYTTK